MPNIAYLPIVADRYGACVRHVFVVGLDLTGIDMRAQVRLSGDTPGVPDVDLRTVTNGNAEGLRLVEVTVTDGLPTSHVQITINESTMEALPYAAVLGDAMQLAWDWQITIAGRKRRLAKGEFEITGDGVTGADSAPTNRPQTYGRPRQPIINFWSSARLTFGEEQVTVTIDGTDLIAPLVEKAGQSESAAAASEIDAAKSAAAAQLAESAAIAAAGTLYPTSAAGLAATAANGFYTVVGDGTSTYAILYQKVNGAAVEKARYASKAAYEGPDGSGLVGYRLSAQNSVQRTSAAKMAESLSVKDFGANGNGLRTPSEHQGFNLALTSVLNPNDAYFSGSVTVPAGDYRFTGPIDLPASFSFLDSEVGAVLWGPAGAPVIQANGVSYVRSNIRGVRTYGGTDALHIGTLGEVASLTITDATFAAYSGTGIFCGASPAGGMTSCKITRVYVDASSSPNGYGLHCADGINNNNLVADTDFGNVKNDVIRVENEAKGWQFRNVRLEANGRLGKAQYHLERPLGNHILGGWSEGSNEFLVRTTAQDDPLAFGILIDGLVSIGSSDGVGFVGSKFDTGANRIVLGTNAWYTTTDAPALCFIYGVNRNLRTNKSVVFTRDTGVSAQLTSALRTTGGATRRIAITATRVSGRDFTANQQLVRLRINALLVGISGSGTAVDGAVDWDVSVRGHKASIGIPRIVKRDELDGYSAAGVAITCTAEAAGQGSVRIFVDATGLAPAEESGLQIEISAMSIGLLDEDRFVVSVD